MAGGFNLKALPLAFLLAVSSLAFADDPTEAMTPEQKSSFVTAAVKELTTIVDTAQKAADAAKGSKEKSDCISGKMTQLVALKGTVDGAKSAMDSATGAAYDQKVKEINLALTKARSLAGEVQQCANPKSTQNGNTTNNQNNTSSTLLGDGAADTAPATGGASMPDVGAGAGNASASTPLPL